MAVPSLVATIGSTINIAGEAPILAPSSAKTVFVGLLEVAIVTGITGTSHSHGDTVYFAQPSAPLPGDSTVFVEGFPLHRLLDARICLHTTGVVIGNTTVFSG
tara:strand:- start:3559 stop:3867 length:309 start_codon:yes stop_codon:yes gene_type:complete